MMTLATLNILLCSDGSILYVSTYLRCVVVGAAPSPRERDEWKREGNETRHEIQNGIQLPLSLCAMEYYKK